MRWVKFLVSFLFTLALLAFLYFPLGNGIAFSLGKFLDPFQGFWQNAESTNLDWAENLDLPGLRSPVEVVFDDRRVPHVFAQNMEDAARVQGYLQARDRLWQMEFQTMVAAGRLSEVIGIGADSVYLQADRHHRRLGLGFAAEKAREQVLAHPATRSLLEAYAEGVNSWIDQLSAAALPLEYKLLNYEPEPWSVLKTCLLMKYMANDLAARAEDLERTNALSLWGREVYDRVYPAYFPDQKPIAPIDLSGRNVSLAPSPTRPADYHPDSLWMSLTQTVKPNPLNGSNNWAVSGARSQTGRPLLANDPHLGLNLPAIWYEMQIQTPESNVYGVSLPGAPGIIIGFNDSIAWGLTNAGQDVLDYYTLEFQDASRQHYRFDGKWLPVQQRIEAIQIKDGQTYYDTVLYSHHGPVMYDQHFGEYPVALAARWMAHEPSNESLTFLRLMQAHNYEDYLAALESYQCPAQNFVFASHDGDIAIWQQGKYVNKWPEQGAFVLDGSRADHDWQSFIPQDQKPHLYNPPQGFVSSANQHPTDPSYPYYYNGGFDAFRGRRIYQLLSQTERVSVEDMQRFQLDNYSMLAADILPTLLGDLDTTVFDQQTLPAYEALKTWNYWYDRDQIAPTIFQAWWNDLSLSIWRDEFVAADVPLDWPDQISTVLILRDSVNFRFYLEVGDTTKVDRPTLVNQSFDRVVSKLHNEAENLEAWQWGVQKTTDIRHLTRQSALSRLGVITDGNGGILNATGRTHGPSWRMVVALGDEIEAYGIYPGGQSGNPGSPDYDSFIEPWSKGEYASLWFMKTAADTSQAIRIRQSFHPKGE